MIAGAADVKGLWMTWGFVKRVGWLGTREVPVVRYI